MGHSTAVDDKLGRKFFLDEPDDLANDEPVTFLLSIHGGGSHGRWQHLYFPAHEYANQYRLVVATPSAATREPMRRWVAEADDEHLQNIVEYVFDKYGKDRIRAFWLVGHSQGGMTSNRLLLDSGFFRERVDGWLSLSGGRIGPIEIPADFFAGRDIGQMPDIPEGQPAPGKAVAPDCDFSFIFATGEHEMVALPDTSPWAEKYGAGERVRLPDVIDTDAGQVTGMTPDRGKGWGREARPGTAEVYAYPDAKYGKVIADVVRLDKGHTEGLEPKITEQIIQLMIQEPGGKATQASK